MQHYGIYLHNNIDRESIIKSIFANRYKWVLAGNGLVFNEKAIEKIIDEERRHDHYVIQTATNSSVGSMSSGEQKKAVLQYFISLQPGFIILDDWGGNLDTANVAAMQQLIATAASSIQFVQLFYRRAEVLPVVQTVLSISDGLSPISQTREAFLQATLPAHSFQLQQLPVWEQWVMDDAPLVELRNVSVSYEERPILHAINWTIRAGEFWQLKGPNGSGKTTLTGMIIGDNPKGYGQELYLFGRKKGTGESVWDIKKNIGYFYPAMSLFFTRNDTVEHMLIGGLTDSIGLYQQPTEWQQITVRQWLQLLGPAYQHKRFSELTPGQQRIILVLRALVKLPPLLILDEPTAGLDDENTEVFIQLTNALAALKKIAIIYISHRAEPQIVPGKILELVPGPRGSQGIIR